VRSRRCRGSGRLGRGSPGRPASSRGCRHQKDRGVRRSQDANNPAGMREWLRPPPRRRPGRGPDRRACGGHRAGLVGPASREARNSRVTQVFGDPYPGGAVETRRSPRVALVVLSQRGVCRAGGRARRNPAGLGAAAVPPDPPSDMHQVRRAARRVPARLSGPGDEPARSGPRVRRGTWWSAADRGGEVYLRPWG